MDYNSCSTAAVIITVVIEKLLVVIVKLAIQYLVVLPSVGSYSQMKRLVRNLTTKAEENNRKQAQNMKQHKKNIAG